MTFARLTVIVVAVLGAASVGYFVGWADGLRESR